ncbi:MAG: hypothetical protein R6V77_03630, partial [Candidatus Cloacimonadaceae bacterium]
IVLLQTIRRTMATILTVDASYDRLRLLGLSDDQIKRIEKQVRVDDRLIISAPSRHHDYALSRFSD